MNNAFWQQVPNFNSIALLKWWKQSLYVVCNSVIVNIRFSEEVLSNIKNKNLFLVLTGVLLNAFLLDAFVVNKQKPVASKILQNENNPLHPMD